MINILVDEVYAFDFLSILHIKKDSARYNQCLNQIRMQISNTDTILESQEYKKVYDANLKVFDAINKSKKDLVKASYVEECNYSRYLAKKELQCKFFSNDMTEKKKYE